MTSERSVDRVTAHVLLRPASGDRVTGDTVVSRATLDRLSPGDSARRRAETGFAELGFETASRGVLSIAITGPKETFERVFAVKLAVSTRGDVEVFREGLERGHELPVAALPSSLSEIVEAATFAPAPDFGPASFH